MAGFEHRCWACVAHLDGSASSASVRVSVGAKCSRKNLSCLVPCCRWLSAECIISCSQSSCFPASWIKDLSKMYHDACALLCWGLQVARVLAMELLHVPCPASTHRGILGTVCISAEWEGPPESSSAHGSPLSLWGQSESSFLHWFFSKWEPNANFEKLTQTPKSRNYQTLLQVLSLMVLSPFLQALLVLMEKGQWWGTRLVGKTHGIPWACALCLSPAFLPPQWPIAASMLTAISACTWFWKQPGSVFIQLMLHYFAVFRLAIGSSSFPWN